MEDHDGIKANDEVELVMDVVVVMLDVLSQIQPDEPVDGYVNTLSMDQSPADTDKGLEFPEKVFDEPAHCDGDPNLTSRYSIISASLGQLVSSGNLTKELEDLRARVKNKEDKLRQLKLLGTYKKENSFEELVVLVDKWKQVAQAAASDLYGQHRSAYEDKITLSDFLKNLDIDASLIDME